MIESRLVGGLNPEESRIRGATVVRQRLPCKKKVTPKRVYGPFGRLRRREVRTWNLYTGSGSPRSSTYTLSGTFHCVSRREGQSPRRRTYSGTDPIRVRCVGTFPRPGGPIPGWSGAWPRPKASRGTRDPPGIHAAWRWDVSCQLPPGLGVGPAARKSFTHRGSHAAVPFSRSSSMPEPWIGVAMPGALPYGS